MKILYLLLLAYLLGPVAAIPYSLYTLGLDPVTVYAYLSLTYILPLPFIYGLLEYGKINKKFPSRSFFKRFAKITKKSAADVLSVGDGLQDEFERRLGRLGFYLAVSVFTFLFGIFWACLFAYVLKIEKSRAILFIAVGVLVGDAFWLVVTLEMLPLKTPFEILSVLALLSLLLYGRKKEKEAIRWLESKVRSTSSA